MTSNPNADKTIREHTDSALDALYAATAGQMLFQINALANAPNSEMQSALDQLDDEAERLIEDGEKLARDNAALKNALATYAALFLTTQQLVLANDNVIQDSGAEVAQMAAIVKVLAGAGALPLVAGNPVSPARLAGYGEVLDVLGIAWRGVAPDAITAAGGYVQSAEWLARMEGWGAGYAELTGNTVLMGLESGWSPIRTAREIRKYAESLPITASENLTRTLQLTAYRDASNAQTANADFIEYKVRFAKLDLKTCLACIDLHGSRLAKGERVDDHYSGRCEELYKIEGVDLPATMQADSVPGQRNFVPFQTGSEWFAGLPPERQAAQASFVSTPAKLNAYNSGVPLSQFVGQHTDDIFKLQIVENSLVGAIGDNANQFYVNQPKE